MCKEVGHLEEKLHFFGREDNTYQNRFVELSNKQDLEEEVYTFDDAMVLKAENDLED